VVATLVNIAGVRETGVVQLVTTVLKFVPLALVGIIGLFFMNADHFTPFAPNGLGTGDGMWGGITAAAALTLWAFIGLESATVPAEEVKDPERTIPRATMLGTLVTTVVYIVATVAIIGVLPLGQSPVDQSSRRRPDVRRTWERWSPLRSSHVRMPERLDLIRGASRSPPRRTGCSRLVLAAARQARPPVFAWSCVPAGVGPDRHELQQVADRSVHLHHPARDADDDRAVRVRSGC
jgi:hypothetical protein